MVVSDVQIVEVALFLAVCRILTLGIRIKTFFLRSWIRAQHTMVVHPQRLRLTVCKTLQRLAVCENLQRLTVCENLQRLTVYENLQRLTVCKTFRG
jgi:hypothetical protein